VKFENLAKKLARGGWFTRRQRVFSGTQQVPRCMSSSGTLQRLVMTVAHCGGGKPRSARRTVARLVSIGGDTAPA
jgi:hypothetical protein